jgi:hypothetical protein
MTIILGNKSFVAGLNMTDLQRLREIVKRVHLRNYPKHMITNFEADKLIDAIGPETAGAIVKASVDLGFVK